MNRNLRLRTLCVAAVLFGAASSATAQSADPSLDTQSDDAPIGEAPPTPPGDAEDAEDADESEDAAEQGPDEEVDEGAPAQDDPEGSSDPESESGPPETELDGTEIAAPAEADEEQIIVTGSRIKRNSFDTPTPVQVMNREQIASSGASNMADLIRIMTANSGSEGQFGLGQGSTGSAQFNLRGLGLANTLVLVNGRRLVPYPDSFGVANSASFSDVNQIPLQFVERIEIAKGGASAIYGSDAIAGVVNIITRKNFDGFEVSATGFTTDKFDQQDGEVAAIFGAESDKSSVVAQFSYFKRSPLAASDRDFTKDTLTSTVGGPGTFLPLGARNGQAIGEAMAMFPDDPGMWPAADVGVVGVMPDAGCGAPGSDSMLNEAGDRCLFDYRKDWNLFNEEQRILAYVTAEHRPSDLFQIFGEFGFARKQTNAPQSPSYPLLRSVIVPGDHVDNLDGRPAVFLGRPLGRAAGSGMQRIDVDGYRAIGGLRGELDEAGMRDWSWELAMTWHRNEHTRRNSDILFDKFQDAVNSCSDPNDLSDCFNPYYSAVDGTGTTNSAEVVDRISGQFKTLNEVELFVSDASMSGPLMSLPGGDLAVAVGGQFRRTTQSIDYDNDSEEQAYAFVIGDEDWSGQQDVVAGFVELSVPFMKGTELQAAVRAEHYENVETSVNPRAALSWRPSGVFEMPAVLERLRFRGSVGTAFRAPNLVQSNGSVTNLEQFFDPGPVFRGARTLPNKTLKPEKSLAYSVGAEWIHKGLNVDVDYWQYNVTDLIIRQNAQQVFSECRAQASDSGVALTEVPGCGGAFEPVPGDANSWQSMNITYANQDEIRTNGIDLAVNYTLETGGGGDLNFGVGGTYVLSYMVPATAVPELTLDDDDPADTNPAERIAQDGCEGDECDIAGKRNQNNFGRPLPRLRMRPSIAWLLDGHIVNVALNYIGAYDDDANFDTATGELNTIDSWGTVDMSYGYRLGDSAVGSQTQVRVGVNNMLDASPPTVENENFGYDIFTHDPRGRVLYANLTHKF